jgi:murein DD-endopeptidase MepM/ murein hydrolase activator NlpD
VIGPHSFGGPENRFGAGRVGHIHQGQDVLASEGQGVVAPLSGTVITTGYQAGGAGWYVAEQANDGLSFFYAHCQAGSVAVAVEQTVRAGQPICRVGQTGDATGPHLHFEVWVGGWRVGHGYPIDPLPYLQAWDR